MTLFLLDISRYQVERPDPLDLVRAKALNFSIVNIALTGGKGYVSGAWANQYADQARALGMGVCCYHWLHGGQTGAEQARASLRRMNEIGATAHQVDTEDPSVTFPIWWDYVRAMQDGLQRHILNYSGDWFWDHASRRWPGSDLTPYLMAQPNLGKQPAYPGDTSSHWLAGYGGWIELSVMQYRVGKVGTVDCSLSAIRDPSVWNRLTGGDMADWRVARGLDKLLAQINAMAPNRSKASDGSIGDPAHQDRPSDHNPDAQGIVRARDFTHDPGHGADMAEIAEALRLSRDRRIKYAIFNRRIFSATNQPWVWRTYTGTNPHDKHMHVSTVDDNTIADNTSDWEIGDNVSAEEVLNYQYEDGSTLKNNVHFAYLWSRQLLAELPALRAANQKLAEAQAADRDISPEELTAAVQAGVSQAGDALTAALVPQLVAGLIPHMAGASEADVERIVTEVISGVRLVPPGQA